MKEFIAKIRQRYNPSSRWTDIDPVLDAGEIGIESDTGFFKFGDGEHPWTKLGYAMTHATVEVDRTLTEDGEAADALVTGDKLRSLELDVEKLKYKESGGLNAKIKITGLKNKAEDEGFLEGRTTAEKGEIFEQVKISWSLGIEPKAIVFVYSNGSTEDIDTKNFKGMDIIDENKINGNSRWILKVTNPFEQEETFSVNLNFYNYLYYGSFPNDSEINAELIHTKNKEPLTNGRKISFEITVPAGEQPFVALPSSLKTPEVSIKLVESTANVTASLETTLDMPAIYAEKDKINYSIWKFSNPPSQEEKWRVALE